MSISRRSFFRVLIIVVLLATFGIHAVGAAVPAVGEARVGVLKVTPHKVNFKKLNLAKRSMRSKYIWVTNKGKGDLTVTFGRFTRTSILWLLPSASGLHRASCDPTQTAVSASRYSNRPRRASRLGQHS